MIQKAVLILITIISGYYCLTIGYLWTGYGHGGQLAGIPFFIALLSLTAVYFGVHEKRLRQNLFFIAVAFFLAMAGFAITVECINRFTPDAFNILYGDNGKVDLILLLWAILGLVGLWLLFRYGRTPKRAST